MEFTLRCNNLKCRKEVSGHAVVTTCSHVFCIDCSNRYQLSGCREGLSMVCPACDNQLRNPDDIVVTNLNPTEDYKTSVLSGLSPNIIMECAGRALNWWAYQTTQEIIYQGCMSKNLQEKYSTLNMQMDKIINDANAEISNLRNKLSSMQIDQDNLRRKNEEITQAFREKSRKHLQTQELYDKLKRRAMLGQVQNAASDAVDHTIQASVAANRFVDKVDHQGQRPPPPPLFANQQATDVQLAGRMSNSMGPPAMRPENQPSQPLSTHRQPLGPGHRQRQSQQPPTPRLGMANFQSNTSNFQQNPTNFQSINPIGTPMQQSGPSPRAPLSSINNNVSNGAQFANYGMSAGLKVSNPTSAAANGAQRPLIRSRVAHRPTPGFPANRDSAFAPPPNQNMFSNGSNFY
ncbi:hypothetical protein G7Y89_g4578 [Cudoniella acicularis]|uniref:RING-type domain-containing protein n=1 Tax=Cudoniella acicularis TaxID=354080 RepID=A0A8H4RQG4_9HELO|nr:hypothetical protein G7Y89_g4578 [Cudoniella acicularis]